MPSWGSLKPETRARFIDKYLADASGIAKRTGGASFERKDVVEFIHCLETGERPIGLNDTQERILRDLFEAVGKKLHLTFKPPKGAAPTPSPSLSSDADTDAEPPPSAPLAEERKVGGEGGAEASKVPSPPEVIGVRAMTPAPQEPAPASSDGEAERGEPDNPAVRVFAPAGLTPYERWDGATQTLTVEDPNRSKSARATKTEGFPGVTDARAGAEPSGPVETRADEPAPADGIEVVGSTDRIGAPPAPLTRPPPLFSPKRQIVLLREHYLAAEPENGHPHALREWVAPVLDSAVQFAQKPANGHRQLDRVAALTYEEVGSVLAPALLDMRQGERADYDRLRVAVAKLYEACAIADAAGEYVDLKRVTEG